MPNYTPSQVYDKYVALQKQLATNITNKGVTASEDELYDNLIDKVAQIEELKGEEKVLENFTNALDEPKSVVQLEYPEPKNLFNQQLLTNWGLTLTDDKYVGTSSYFSEKTLASNFQSNTQYTISLKGYNTNSTRASVLISVNYTDGTSATIIRLVSTSETEYKFTSAVGKTVSSFKSTYYNADIVNISYIQIEKGSTPTTYEPYPTPKTLNAKLSSKNLIPYPYHTPPSTINGIIFTANADGSISFSGTSTGQATFYFVYGTMNLKQGVTYTLSVSGDYSFGGSSTLYIYDPTQGQSAYIPLLTDTSATFTPTGNINNTNCYLVIPANRTVSGTLKPQLEIGSTATAYTPYISDFSTVNVTRCGKNILPYPYTYTTREINGVQWTVNVDGTITATGTAAANSIFQINNTSKEANLKLTPGTTYTISSGLSTDISGVSIVCNYYPKDATAYDAWLNTATSRTGTFPNDGYNIACYLLVIKDTTVENLTFKPQLELGSTATEYEPYQGQTYTPTATGEVTGITNLYPLTTLITDNAGVVFTEIVGGTYKEILPSTDKNGITKVLQPSVDSTIDSNITSDNIKQGVSILGVTGDYICNYTYDETTKELVLLI